MYIYNPWTIWRSKLLTMKSITLSFLSNGFNTKLQLRHTHSKQSSSTAPTAFLESEDLTVYLNKYIIWLHGVKTAPQKKCKLIFIMSSLLVSWFSTCISRFKDCLSSPHFLSSINLSN